MKTFVALLVVLASVAVTAAQSSSSYRLSESTFNLGGRPQAGQVASSSSYTVTLDSIGEAVAASGLASSSFHMDGGFLNTYPPPGEVLNLNLDTPTHLLWSAQSAAGEYNVYRGTITALPGDYGVCLETGIATTEATDALVPPLGGAYFYVVTASNRLGEEGTKGYNGAGAERPNASPCP